MGVVYLAEQTEPVRRKVAIKVVKRGMSTRDVLDRFEAETQALALMDHPTIARVFQAGATEQGLPYFAMEYVDGVSITAYCDRERMPLRDRLELLSRVCAGVQHAHRKGVIHRDLKPSNVLVTGVDGEAVPKIIDFGVAKAVEQRLTERSLFTELGVIVGTPEYMSPEQTELTGERVDTRTDVYALGVLQYELITGALPFNSEELRAGGFDQICRRIREDEPARPSARICDTDPALARELDWVTMKALAKDPERRYGSPQELADDLNRYLRNEPVVAGPPSAAYRAKKFVRRNRLAVGSAAAILLALIAGIVAATIFGLGEAEQRRQAEAAKSDLETVVEFQARMISDVDPQQMGANLLADLQQRIDQAVPGFDSGLDRINGTDAALKVIDEEVLARAADVLDREFDDRPLIEARLRRTIARAYRELGLRRRAEPHAVRALELLRRELGPTDPTTLDAIGELGFLYLRLDRYQEAEDVLVGGLATAREVLGAEHPETLSMMNHLGVVHWNAGQYDRAEPLFLEASATRERLLGPDHVDTLTTLGNLGLLYWGQGRLEQAEETLRKAVDAQRRVLDHDNRGRLMTLRDLAIVYQNLGRFSEAEQHYREALEAQRRALGTEHEDTLTTQLNLATLLDDLGHDDEAEALYRLNLETERRVLGPSHSNTCFSLLNLGSFLGDRKQLDEAEARTLEAIDCFASGSAAEHPAAHAARVNVADFLAQRGLQSESLTLYHEAIDSLIGLLGPDHDLVLQAKAGLASAYARFGRVEEADAIFRQAAEHPATVSAVKEAYARFLLDHDENAALGYALEANEMTGHEIPDLLETLAIVYRRLGRDADALATCDRAIEVLSEEHPRRGRFEQLAAELKSE